MASVSETVVLACALLACVSGIAECCSGEFQHLGGIGGWNKTI